ncbi:MAG: large-conductance mechanosensitive channel protein MscL [Syntrophaceae bacterium]
MGMFQEFKTFAMKGNMVDMAVGIIVGAAFGKIISSLVGDVIMPPIGMALGGVDFSNLVIVMQAATEQAPAVVLSYGKFIQSIVDFLIIALCIFLVVKGINNLKKKEEAAPAAPPNQEVLLAEIRDLLKTRK